jgi:hypothetical protein
MIETILMLAALLVVAVLGGSSVNPAIAGGMLAIMFGAFAAWRAFRRQPGAGNYALKAVACLALIGLLFGLNAANKKAGRAGAEKIAAACEAYKVKTGGYPASLELLAPDYLPHVPAAKYSLRWSRYWLSGTRVMFVAEPGLLVNFYDLLSKEWGAAGMYKVLGGI